MAAHMDQHMDDTLYHALCRKRPRKAPWVCHIKNVGPETHNKCANIPVHNHTEKASPNTGVIARMD